MPSIGNPNVGRDNPFGKIGIHKSAEEKSKIGDQLNRMARKEQTAGFVDRAKHNNLGKDGFLKLLSHQLANQDPLTPMDQKRFAADLAQFSQLEQLANINSRMEKSGKNVPTQNKFYGASFIGKKVLTNGTTINYEVGDRPALPFYLSKRAEKAIIKIYDDNKNVIRQLEVDNLAKGNQLVEWDGNGEDHFPVAKGVYHFDVMAFDEQYHNFRGDTRAKGMVTGVNFENGETVLIVDGSKRVFLRDVKQFQIPEHKERLGTSSHLKKAAKEAYNNIVRQ